MNTPCAIIQVYCEVIKTDFFFKKLSQIMLKEVSTCTFLEKLRYSKKPGHFSILFLETVLYLFSRGSSQGNCRDGQCILIRAHQIHIGLLKGGTLNLHQLVYDCFPV